MAFTAGDTPFGIFDTDTEFQSDADKLVTWVKRKLGCPVLDVELSSSHIYQSFEEAAVEYSSMINSYQAKSSLASMLGMSTGSLSGSENRYPHNLLEFERRMTQPYGEESKVGGDFTLYSGSITLGIGVQDYDLPTLLSGTIPVDATGRSKRIIIDKLFHFDPVTSFRFFGTTSAVNFLNNAFGFESFTPETIFYLLPIWEDILRGMQFETSNRVRRSQYSFDIRNNQLKIYPPPSTSTTLFLTFRVTERTPFDPDYSDVTVDGVSNLSNVPFGHIQYSRINSISKQWIWKMTYALSKEILGQIRSKISTIPIPNGDLTLNGPELITDARSEIDDLRLQLRELLEDTTYEKIAERQAKVSEDLNRALLGVPLKIYTG